MSNTAEGKTASASGTSTVPTTFEVTPRSGRKIVMRELTGLEQVESDRIAANQTVLAQYRTIQAIVSIDGVPRKKMSNDIDVKAYMQTLKGSDGDAAMGAYNERYIVKGVDVPFTVDGDKVTVTCKPSGLVVTMTELDYRVQTLADKLGGSVWAMDAFRTVFSITAIGGKTVTPFSSKADAEARLAQLPGHVVEQCAYVYQKAFATTAEDLGNESERVDFPPSLSQPGPELAEPS